MASKGTRWYQGSEAKRLKKRQFFAKWGRGLFALWLLSGVLNVFLALTALHRHDHFGLIGDGSLAVAQLGLAVVYLVGWRRARQEASPPEASN